MQLAPLPPRHAPPALFPPARSPPSRTAPLAPRTARFADARCAQFREYLAAHGYPVEQLGLHDDASETATQLADEKEKGGDDGSADVKVHPAA